MENQDVLIYALVDHYQIPFALTTSLEQAEDAMDMYYADNADDIEVDDDGDDMDTDAGIVTTTLDEFLKTSPDLLTSAQLTELMSGELIVL